MGARQRPHRPAVLATLAAAALLVGACADNGSPPSQVASGDESVDESPDTTQPTDDDTTTTVGGTAPGTTEHRDGDVPGAGRFTRALEPFADCAAFLDHVRAEARERVGPWGLSNDGWWWVDDLAVEEMAEDDMAADEPAAEEPADASDAGAPGSAGDDGDSDVTGTNVQEAGVDEPDIVKSDGDRILAVSDNRLFMIDITGDVPAITDRLDLPEGWDHELFFDGDRAILFTNGGTYLGDPAPIDVTVGTVDAEAEFADGEIPPIEPGLWAPAALVIEVDLSEPTDLRVASTLRIEGSYLSARRVGDTVRMALSTGPQQLPWVFPQNPSGEERATETNRALIDETTLADWTPGYELVVGGDTRTGDVLACDRLNHPDEFSGFDVISVLDIDMTTGIANGFDPSNAVGVLAGGNTIYSSLDRFYVATTKWVGQDDVVDGQVAPVWNDEFETELHAFEFVPGAPARYLASGAVDGSLLNQFSLDEHEGFLRVITTDGSPWNQDDLSSTGLTVLREDGETLVQVGHVGGLGEGESLYAARLLDEVGFAVTFRQIDPFYVLDLRDPANPQVTGELKIPGFSTYLHPLGDGRVLGIGQNATEDGQVTGLKVSMFDVSDPAAPRETATWTLDNANSDAEYDHRAFQISGSTVILPVTQWGDDWVGAVLLDVSAGITEIGRVTHLAPESAPTSDCLPLGPDDVPEESELWWMVTDGYGHVQLCGADDVGGWGSYYCDPVPVEDVRWWTDDPESMDAALEALGATAGDRVEMCWPDGNWQQQIRRSLVADDVLYTVSRDALQANRMGDLSTIAQLPLQ